MGGGLWSPLHQALSGAQWLTGDLIQPGGGLCLAQEAAGLEARVSGKAKGVPTLSSNIKIAPKVASHGASFPLRLDPGLR